MRRKTGDGIPLLGMKCCHGLVAEFLAALIADKRLRGITGLQALNSSLRLLLVDVVFALVLELFQGLVLSLL